jgi:hypothetical protein
MMLCSISKTCNFKWLLQENICKNCQLNFVDIILQISEWCWSVSWTQGTQISEIQGSVFDGSILTAWCPARPIWAMRSHQTHHFLHRFHKQPHRATWAYLVLRVYPIGTRNLWRIKIMVLIIHAILIFCLIDEKLGMLIVHAIYCVRQLFVIRACA